MSDNVVRNFRAYAGNEGPQIILTWDHPTNPFAEIEIWRKLGCYPEYPSDGVLIYKGRGHNVSDTKLSGMRIYYYTAFTKIGATYYSETSSKQKSLAYKTGEMRDIIWNHLLVSSKTIFDNVDKRKLSLSTNIVDGEIFNLEQSTETYGQLWRIIKVIGLIFDRIKALIDFMPNAWDVDKTDIDYLDAFAELLGIENSSALQVYQQRERLKNVSNVYKYKGTERSYLLMAQSTVGHSVYIADTSKNVFMVGDVLPTLSDPLVAFLRYTPWDIQKVIGSTGWGIGFYGHDKIIDFIDKSTNMLYSTSVNVLINRTTVQFAPCFVRASYVIMVRRTQTPIQNFGSTTFTAVP